MKKILFLFIGYCLIFQAITMIQAEKNGKIVIIVNKKSLSGKEIDTTKLKNIYFGKTKSEGSVKFIPVHSKDKELFLQFLKKFADVTENAYQSYWVKKVFAEGSVAPKVIGEGKDIIKYISENEGAIGYIWDSDLTNKEEGIEVINVDVRKSKKNKSETINENVIVAGFSLCFTMCRRRKQNV
ncbi:MAG: hypothetical protein AABY84_05125 [Candidatus Firestonebacteria bacterium]